MQALISHSFEYGRNFVSQQTGYAFFVRGFSELRIFYLESFMTKTFGENLRLLRISSGYTQAELARLLNIDRTTLTKYETGVTEPDLVKLEKLCRILKIDYNTLLDYKDK